MAKKMVKEIKEDEEENIPDVLLSEIYDMRRAGKYLGLRPSSMKYHVHGRKARTESGFAGGTLKPDGREILGIGIIWFSKKTLDKWDMERSHFAGRRGRSVEETAQQGTEEESSDAGQSGK